MDKTKDPVLLVMEFKQLQERSQQMLNRAKEIARQLTSEALRGSFSPSQEAIMSRILNSPFGQVPDSVDKFLAETEREDDGYSKEV